MRPLTAAVAAAGRGTFVLDGVARMRERPIADLVDGLVQLGVDAKCTMGTGCPPVEVKAAGLPPGKVRCCLRAVGGCCGGGKVQRRTAGAAARLAPRQRGLAGGWVAWSQSSPPAPEPTPQNPLAPPPPPSAGPAQRQRV